jgi:hypothetical protein
MKLSSTSVDRTTNVEHNLVAGITVYEQGLVLLLQRLARERFALQHQHELVRESAYVISLRSA